VGDRPVTHFGELLNAFRGRRRAPWTLHVEDSPPVELDLPVALDQRFGGDRALTPLGEAVIESVLPGPRPRRRAFSRATAWSAVEGERLLGWVSLVSDIRESVGEPLALHGGARRPAGCRCR
jgi:hypothetical protein